MFRRVQFERFPTTSFLRWKTSFRTEVCSGSISIRKQCVGSMKSSWLPGDDLQTSRSTTGQHFPNFQALDAKIALSLKKIIQNSRFRKKRSSSRSRWLKKMSRSCRGTHIFLLIYEHVRVTGTHVAILDDSDLISIALHGDNM